MHSFLCIQPELDSVKGCQKYDLLDLTLNKYNIYV
jgi:hypothetical protein